MLETGMVIGGRYEILNKIGSGGMSVVYKAIDQKLNRNVAVKVLKNEFREDKNFVRKFKEEAQAAARLAHPNIVNVYDVGEEDNIHYIVMELVEGITLKHYIERKGKVAIREATSIAIQVSMGLEVAHNNDIIHRDIKPQNIMISKEGKVKVMDFGIAKAASSETIASNAMGSVHYTSPEQARGGYSEAKSDIYSLGIVMFEMVTGRVPFDGETTVAVAVKHLQEEMPSPRTYCPEIPISLEKIIFKCTEKIAAKRYSNMAELILDLKQSLQTPDKDFVKQVDVDETAKTVMITKDVITQIKKETGRGNAEEENSVKSQKDAEGEETAEEVPFVHTAHEEKNSEEEYDNQEEELEDEDDELDPRMEKIMTIGGIAAAIIILIIIFLLAGKIFGMGLIGGNSDDQQQQTEVNEEDMILMIDVRGMTWEEAKKALNDMGLGITSGGSEESEEYEDGTIMKQSVEPDEKVAKNSTIEVIIASHVGKMIKIPDVIGESKEDAAYRLEQEGFVVDYSEIYDDEISEGNVVKTSPQTGTEVPEGSTIVLTISKGPEVKYTTVPSLVGKTRSEAETALRDKNLKASVTEEYSSEVEEGIVISQRQASGAEVEENSTVHFVVSKGAEKVTIPELMGRTAERAKEKLSEAGLYINLEEEYSDKPKGEVIGCEPSEGTEVEKGLTVKVIISKGAEPTPEPTKEPTKAPVQEPTQAPQQEPTQAPVQEPENSDTENNEENTSENTAGNDTAGTEGDTSTEQ